MNSWVSNAARTAVMALAGVLCGTAWGQTTDFNTGTDGFVINESSGGSFSTVVQGWTVIVSTDPSATTTRLRLTTATLDNAPSAGTIRAIGTPGQFNFLEFRSASQFDFDSIWTTAVDSTTIQALDASYAPVGSAVAYSTPPNTQTQIDLSANTDFDGIYGFRIVPSDRNSPEPISQVTISNVGTPPTVTLAASPASIGETGGSSTVTATLSGTASTATTVNLAFSGTASGGGTDYTASNTSITIPSGSTTGSVTLSAVSDAIAEANETIIVDISSVSGGDGATESGTQQATVTITDDDSAAVTIADVSQAENGGAVTFTATLSAAVQNGFTVDVSTADGTATVADGDYTAVSGQTLTFAGTSGETQTFTITPGADTKVEPNETVTISMSNLTGASGTVDITDTATLTLTNDDSAAVTIADVSANEDNGAITLTATLDNAVAGGFTVDVSSADGTATTADSDYTAISGQTLTFAGTASETQTFTLTPTSDTKLEANETISVSMSNLAATALSVTITDTATVTFNNDDTAAVTIADASGDEDAGAVTFTATLSNAVQGGFTVDVSTSDGTATTSDSDYTAITGQTLTFTGTASETQTFTVTPTADSAIEAAETVNIAMSNLAGTGLGVDISDTATLTINNDDADAIAPRVQSITRSNPATSPTSASTLDWAVAFNETVNNVDSTDFVVTGASVAPSITVLGSGANYTVRATGGSLSGMNGTVTLSFAPGQNIADTSANALSNTTPIGANDNTFLISNPTPPAFSLTFSPSSMAQGAASTLTYTINNSANVVNATSLDFTNTLPANVSVAATPNASTTCTGGTLTATSGAASISYSGGTVSASGSCTVSVDVTSSTAGAYTNTTGSLTSSLGNSGTASGGLTVTDDTSPTLSSITRLTPANETTDADAVTWRVVFSETVLNVGAADFTVSGPSGASIGVTGSGSAYDVTVSGGDMAGLNATITLNIAGGNDIADAAANALASTTPSGTDERTYIISNPTPPIFSLTFSPSSMAQGAASTLTYTINNSANVVNATSLDFTNTLPANVSVAATPNASTTCTGGTLTATSGAASISYSGGTVSASGSCTVSVDVTSSTAGAYTNTTGNLTSSLGNSGTASGGLTVTDDTSPTLSSITRLTPANETTDADAVTWRVVFSETVVNVGATDFTISGPSGASIGVTGSGSAYDVTVSGGDMAGLNATITLNIAGGNDIADAAANALASTTPSGTDERTYLISNPTPPAFSLTFSPSSMAQGAASTLTYTINNSANVVNATSLDFTNTLPANVSVAATPNASTTCTGGTLTATSGAASISYSGGTVSASGSCTVSVDVTSSTAGAYTNTTGNLTSSLGNSGTASGGLTVTDDTSPTLSSITRLTPANETTDADAVTWRVVFSETVVNVGAADFTISGPSGASIGVTGSGSAYDVTVSGGDMAGLNATITLNIAGGNDIADAAANALASTTPSGTDERTYIISNPTPPIFSLTFSPSSMAQGAASTLTYTINNSANVVNATSLDFTNTLPANVIVAATPNASTTCTGGTLTATSGAASISYSGGTVSASGSCTVSVDVTSSTAGAYTNTTGNLTSSLGNSGTASGGLTVTDDTSPTLSSITRLTPANETTDADAVTWRVVFSETVVNVGAADFTVSGPSGASIGVTGSGGAYDVTVSGGDMAGLNATITLNIAGGNDIADAAANALASTTPSGTDERTYLISNPGAPGFTAAFSPNTVAAGGTATLTFSINNASNVVPATALGFSNALPSGLTLAAAPNASTTCTGGTLTATSGASSFSYSGGSVAASASCTLSVTVQTSSQGVFTNTSGALSSSLGASGGATASLTATDATPPVLTAIERQSPTAALTNSDTLVFAISFSETVSNVTADDFTILGTTATGVLSGSGASYTLTLSGGDLATLEGSVSLNLSGGQDITDLAGNALPAGEPGVDQSYTLDNTSPGVTLSTASNAPASGPYTLSVTFTEAVTGFALGDLTVSNGVASDLTSLSPSSYTVTISPSDDGVVTVDLGAGVATDAAGNVNSAAVQVSRTTDSTAPSVEITGPSDAALSGPFAVTITFSETVSGFTLDDISVSNGSASDFDTISEQTYRALITPSDDGPVTVDVAANAAEDAAGNGNLAADRFSTFNDATSPTVTLTRAGNGLATGPFDVTISFSEPVSGLALEDLAVGHGEASALTGSEAQYAVTITPSADAEVTIDLAAGVVVDTAGNPNFAADTLRVSVDSTAPVLTITLPGATTVGPFTARFTFDEHVSGFEASDILVTNGAISDFLIETERSFTALITPATAGPVTVEVANAAASDQAGNGNEAAQAIIEAITGTEDVEIVIDQTTGDVTDIKAEVRIGNPGSQSLNFRVEVDVPWISVDPVSGVIPALGDILLNVQVLPEAADLPAGVYSGVITVVRDLPASPLMRPSATGRAATESIIVEIPLTVTIEERFGSIQLVATTPGGVQRDATFSYSSSDAELNGLQLTTVGGSAASASFEKEAGLYDVSQSAPEGWRLDEISCTGDLDGGSVITLSNGRVLIDLDPTEAITCTFSSTRDEDAVRLATQRAINNFMVRRADRILAAAPDLSQRLQERQTDTPGQFSAHVEGDRKALSLSTSLSGVRNHIQASEPQMPNGPRLDQQERPNLDIWMRAEFSAISDDRDGSDASSDFGLLQIGADWTLGESALVGVMVQRDWMDETSAEIAQSAGALRGARVQGQGWMAGPYLAWGLSDSAWLDVLAMWGQSENTVDPLGLYEDEFDTDRLMIRANLTGEWQSANWRVRPSISLAHFEETQGGYTDSLGIEIPEQTIRIGRLQAGPEVSYRFERRNGGWWEPGLSLNGVWDYDPAALMDELGQRISTGALRADAGLSLRARLSDGAMLSGEVRLDGLGDGDFSANSGRLEIRLPF